MLKVAKKQKGYATVLTLILFSALGLSLFAVFNSGQIVTHKLKLQNAVDAATYSSVNVVAREMNYIAYTNRAMVANQLAIGQMVGLSSWSKQIVETIGTLDKLARFVTFISGGSINLAAITAKVKEIAELGDTVADGFIDVSIPFEKAANMALSASQRSVHFATSAITLEVFKTVLKDNNDSNGNAEDKIESAALASLVSVMPGYEKIQKVEPPSPNQFGVNSTSSEQLADFDNYKGLIEESSDRFVAADKLNGRSYQLFSHSLVVIKVWAEKKGGNKLELKDRGNKYTWDWSAMDALSFYYKWRGCWGGCSTHEIALGWGAAHATDGYPSANNIYDSFYQNSGQFGGGLTQTQQQQLSILSSDIDALENQRDSLEENLVNLRNAPGFDPSNPIDQASAQAVDDQLALIGSEINNKTNQLNQLYSANNNGFGNFSGGIRDGWGNARSNRKSSRKAAQEYSDNQRGFPLPLSGEGVSSNLLSFYKYKSNEKDYKGAEFIAVVSKNENGVRTRNKMIESHAGNTVPADGSFNVEKEGNMVGGNMYAVAKAQVYFARSPDSLEGMLSGFNRAGGINQQEFGNLFNPYWQVRLVDYEPNEISDARDLLDGS